MSEPQLTPADNELIARRIREELARRRISRQYLADAAKLSLSTLEKALSGQRPFTLASVVRLEEALNIGLRASGAAPQGSRNGEVAPETLGSYARPAVRWLLGDYLTLRPSFSTPDAYYAYCTSIAWDDDKSHLVFRESERRDAAYTQSGDVSVPHQSGYIYLVTNKLGQYRLIILSRPAISGEMFGLLTTLQSGKGAQLMPVSTPLVLAPLSHFGKGFAFGKVLPGNAAYDACRDLMARVTGEPFALLGPPA
jgi:transcriptional regulator with XRE-family HTH domain